MFFTSTACQPSFVSRVQKMIFCRLIQGKSLMMSLTIVITTWRLMKEVMTVIVRVKLTKGKTLWAGPVSHTYQMQVYQETSVKRFVQTPSMFTFPFLHVRIIISHHISSSPMTSHHLTTSPITFCHLPLSSVTSQHLPSYFNFFHHLPSPSIISHHLPPPPIISLFFSCR